MTWKQTMYENAYYWKWIQYHPSEPLMPSDDPPPSLPIHPHTIELMAQTQETEEEQMARTKREGKPFLDQSLVTAYGRKLGIKPVEGEVGLELECEGKNLYMSPISFWKAVPDHSLRPVGEHQPVEYVLREPLPRTQIGEALDYLEARLQGAKSELIFSHRTSVHVHVNCQTLSMRELAQFLCLYFIFEDLLVEFSGNERKGNLFCLRAKDAEFQIEMLTKAYRTFNFGDVFNQNYRYSACNLASLSAHGSLEFRSMRGTVDKAVIQDWIRLLLHLKDRAMMFSTPAHIADLFTKMGPLSFADFVFANCPVAPQTRSWFIHHQDLNQSLWTGLRTMRDVAHAIDWNTPPRIKHQCVRTTDMETEYDDD